MIPEPVSAPEAVSAREAARLAGVSRTTLYAALAGGGLPSLKVGRRRLVRLEALRGWLAKLEALHARPHPPPTVGRARPATASPPQA